MIQRTDNDDTGEYLLTPEFTSYSTVEMTSYDLGAMTALSS